LAYAQYTHDVPDHGDLITVYEGLYATRPDPIELATRTPVQIKLITLLDHGLRHRMMALAGSAPIPEHSQVFPVFRNRPPWSDRWGFWDGKREWQADWDDLQEDRSEDASRGFVVARSDLGRSFASACVGPPGSRIPNS
jgi:hypothetical protein